MSTSDFKLDARLRDVAVPSGLLDRLALVPYADDAGMDDAVRDVEMPSGLRERLLAIPLADDDGLDEALRSVPLPRRLATTVRRHARHRAERPIDRAMRLSRVAMALSLIFALAFSLGSIAWIINQMANVGQVVKFDQRNLPAVQQKPQPLEWSLGTVAGDDFGPGATVPNEAGAAARRELPLAQLEPSGDRQRRESLVESMPRMADPLASQASDNPIVIHGSWEELHEVAVRPPSLARQGLDWPLVPGANQDFIIAKKFHPFVMPMAGAALQSCPVPLSVDGSSYELTRRYLEKKELPPPDRVRTEDFLAAMDYGFPQPREPGLGLTVAGGPSPICGEGFNLLQVGVAAWQGEAKQHAPLHLVLLVDTSTSMRWGSRMEVVRRALAGLPDLLGPDDRVSLVTFNQAAHVLVENLETESLSQYRAAAESLVAEGSTNFVGGLREATGVARESFAGNRAARIVVLTDGLLGLDRTSSELVERDAADAARQNMRVDAVDLSEQKDTDPQLAAVCRSGAGTAHRAASAEQLRWALREIVTGHPQVVARSARLRVTFNPQAVAEYRILGHESRQWLSMLPGPLETDFHEGQSATGLFEVRLNPNGPDDVATVELTWYSPDAGPAAKPQRRIVATMRRGQFASAAGGCAPALQQAAVAAYMAEVLRRSPFIFERQPGTKLLAALRYARELALDVNPSVAKLPANREFTELIEREMKAHPWRGDKVE